jgi:predicted ester cyclase
MIRAEANKAIARQAIEEVWNRRNLDSIDVLYAVDYVNHDVGSDLSPSRDGYRQWVCSALGDFPDAHLTIEDMVAKGDKVALRYSIRRSRRGVQSGTSPACKMGAIIVRILANQVQESWGVTRIVHLLQRTNPMLESQNGIAGS